MHCAEAFRRCARERWDSSEALIRTEKGGIAGARVIVSSAALHARWELLIPGFQVRPSDSKTQKSCLMLGAN